MVQTIFVLGMTIVTWRDVHAVEDLCRTRLAGAVVRRRAGPDRVR
jgi:hypothetical protein